MRNVKPIKACKRACSLSHWKKASPQALFIVVTGSYARNIERKRSVKTRTLTNKLLHFRQESERLSYYELTDDINFPNRWYLGDIAFSDNWELAKHLDPKREYEIEVYQDGSEMDYTCNEAYGVSVVSKKFKDALVGVAGITFAKANIIGKSSDSEFYIMAVPKELECINEEESEFQKFEVNDPVRPDKAGEYRGFFKMVVNPEKCAGINIFRVKGFSISIIVSAEVKKRLESAGVFGAQFKSV